MTQHEAKWLLAKLQVAERSRAFGHVSSTSWSVFQAGVWFLFSVFYIFSRELKGLQLPIDAGIGMGFLFFHTKQRCLCYWDQQIGLSMLETAHDGRGCSLLSDPRGKNPLSFYTQAKFRPPFIYLGLWQLGNINIWLMVTILCLLTRGTAFP